ncbi:MAG: hypothetical protein GVX78_00995 [Bacteroidetes bacterium]|jgi:hypothetical protein|nr:hypothetical protein [Bacteroidota bacterium]
MPNILQVDDQRSMGSLLFILLSFICTAYGQVDSFDNYEWRIKQAYLFDTYIPSDIEEAYAEIEGLTPPATLRRFATYPEDSIRGRLQLTLGKWLAKNWQLHEGSRLSHYLKKRGLTHPEDMVEFIILGFHRHLNDEPLDSETLIQRLIERRKTKFFESQKKIKKETIFIDTIEGSPPE